MSKFKAQVLDSNVQKFEGVSKAGKDYCFYKQDLWVTLPNAPFPQKVELSHDSAADAKAQGNYEMSIDKAVYVDRFGNLGVDMRKAEFVLDNQAVK